MPIDNLGKIHFTEEEIHAVNQALNLINTTLLGLAENLTAAERSKYGKVGAKNTLLIDKAMDYHRSQPDLQSPEVDWQEFELDYADRIQASQMLSQTKSIEQLLLNIKILRDHDNHTDALRDYQYAKYKNRFTNQAGYETKIDQMKVFFPKTGKTKKSNL
ncbi:hypothetical protein [Flavobacterium psychrotolerans]|uniref:Uncharacterized protein n=1 Tax=Flavobacterium psychrotolerans TaxID=2169410 RepID=A0A2U1JGP0_9FLAO|nr:hypothetical protein [Flavobacterium psychrotolerans]PWA04292.1 hypothetical protein DB895_11785 [Flavobacterium psychrotolerans]